MSVINCLWLLRIRKLELMCHLAHCVYSMLDKSDVGNNPSVACD